MKPAHTKPALPRMYRRRTALIVGIILLLVVIPVHAQYGWHAVPSGTTVPLNRISWTPGPAGPNFPGLLHIAGDSGTFLYSRDVGHTWTSADSVPTTANLNGVVFPYPDTGYVSGDGGVAYRVVRDGDHYLFNVPILPALTGDLNGVSCIPGSVVGFIVGDNGTILRTTTRGLSWVAHNSGTTRNINAVRQPAVVRIFACGDSGMVLRSTSTGNWSLLQLGGAYSGTGFHSIETAGSLGDTVWIAGDNGTILWSRNAAAPTPTWHQVASGVTATFRSITHRIGGSLWAVGDSGVILKSVDGGYAWDLVESGTTENLRDIFMIDDNHGVIVGENGTILLTATAGEYEPIALTPDTLDFGPVIAGSTRTGILNVRNTTDDTVAITFAGSSGGAFSVEPSVMSIPGGEIRPFAVGFSPPSKGSFTSLISIQVDGGAFTAQVPALGEGVDSFPQPAWTWLNPRPQGNQIFDIAFFDAMNGIVVGEEGTIARTSDGGNNWAVSNYPGGIDVRLTAVGILDATSAIGVGEHGLIVHTSDRGASWSSRPAIGPLEPLTGVSFAGPDTGWVVGSEELYQPERIGSIYRTTDGGVTWVNQLTSTLDDPQGLSYETPAAVFATSGTAAVVVGKKISTINGERSGLILRTTDAGDTWMRDTGRYPVLLAVTFTGPSIGFAVGDNGTVLRTSDAGVSWIQSTPLTGTSFNDVAFADPDRGIVIGRGGLPGQFFTYDGGETWTYATTPTVPSLYRVAYPAAGSLFGINGAQRIGHSPDGGITWTESSYSVTTTLLFGVSFRDAQNGVAIDTRGGILKSTDAGATWQHLSGGTLLTQMAHILTSVSAHGADRITVAGKFGTILQSTDGGSTWVDRYSGTTALLSRVSFKGEIGYIVGENGTVLRSEDGGEHWVSQRTSYPNYFLGVDISDNLNAIVVGSSGIILRTSDGGRNWDQATVGNGQWLQDVAFTGAWGSVVGTEGAVFNTTDGGETWHQKDAGTLESLNSVSLAGPNAALAVGTNGVMVHTFDAGDTWTPVPSGTNIDLLDVEFVDDLVGTAVGNFGVMLRTTSGGFPPATVTDAALPTAPVSFGLDQNYPNPFNPATTIRYRLPVESKVVLRVFDILGRIVATLVDARQQAGEQQVVWDARNVASGVYVYRIEATPAGRTGGPYTRDIRMVLVR